MNILKKSLLGLFVTLLNFVTPVSATTFYGKGIAVVRDDYGFSAFNLETRQGEGLSTPELKIEYHFWSLLGDPVFRFRGWYETPSQARVRVSDKCSRWGAENVASDDLRFSGRYATLTEPPVANQSQTFSASERKALFSSSEFLPSTWFALELYSRELNRTVWMETMVDSLVRLPAEPGFWTPGAVNWDRLFLRSDPRKMEGETNFVSWDEAETFYKSGFIVSRAIIIKPSVNLGKISQAIEEFCSQRFDPDDPQNRPYGKDKNRKASDSPFANLTLENESSESAFEAIDRAFSHGQPSSDDEEDQNVDSVFANASAASQIAKPVVASVHAALETKMESCRVEGQYIERHPSWVTNGREVLVANAKIDIYEDKPNFEWNFKGWPEEMTYPGPPVATVIADQEGRYVVEGLRRGRYLTLSTPPAGFRAFERDLSRWYSFSAVRPEDFDKHGWCG